MIGNWTNRQVVQATIAIAVVGAGFWLLFRYYETLLILITAIILSIAVKPIVARLRRLGVPSWLGVSIVYLTLLAVVLGFLIYGLPLMVAQSATVLDQTATLYADFYRQIQASDNRLIHTLARALPATLEFSQMASASQGVPVGDTVEQAWELTVQFVSSLLLVGATFILAFFWTLESDRIKQVIFLLVPINQRQDAKEFVNSVEEIVGGYTVGQGILCLIIGVMSFIAYFFLGVPYAAMLAIIAGIGEAIPLIGPLIGTAPAVLIAFSISPSLALWTAIVGIVIQQVENTFLVPRVMGRYVGAGPVPTIVAFLAFSSLFGLLGALITVPLTATISLILDRILIQRPVEDKVPEGRNRLSVLRYNLNDLVKDVRNQIRRKDEVATAVQDQIEDSIEAIAVDLDSLLARKGGVS